MVRDPYIGAVIGERYVVEREIGRGAMGRLYEARSLVSRSVIAVKFLHPHLLDDEESRERFSRESQAAHRLAPCPYIAKVLATGALNDDYPYICFERLHGESLFERLQRVRPLDVRAVVSLVDNVLEGLVVAHPTLVHRDIKPANLFLVPLPDGAEKAVILDFGISKLEDRRGLTKVQSTLGSVAYMPPEQMEDPAAVDVRADLYAVAAVAFECLTGKLPFAGTTTIELQQFKRHRRSRSLESQMGMGWDRRLAPIAGVLARLLARSRSDRYATARETLDAWRAADPVLVP